MSGRLFRRRHPLPMGQLGDLCNQLAGFLYSGVTVVQALDLLPEVVDPLSGEPLPPGRPGELVLTTLQREALPLIRYRTGDMAVLTETPCACGSPLPRLQRVLGRIVHGPNGIEVTHPRKGGPVR